MTEKMSELTAEELVQQLIAREMAGDRPCANRLHTELLRRLSAASQVQGELSESAGIEYYRNRLLHLKAQVGFIERNFPELALTGNTSQPPEIEPTVNKPPKDEGETTNE
jgi:hypothetical protein